jgi:hypothetical protein
MQWSTTAQAATGVALTLGLSLGLWAGPALASKLEMEDIALEGQLRFLAQRPDPQAYRYEASAVIDTESLQTGVITLKTCHLQLDPNRRVVVAFNRQRVQSIEILNSTGVGRAWVEGHRVELADVQRGGHVCIGLKSRALESQGPGLWRLHAGPLMRRYLDGYLPMDAKLSLTWPSGLLAVTSTQPAPQPGVHLSEGSDGATLNITFAGRMSATWDLRER